MIKQWGKNKKTSYIGCMDISAVVAHQKFTIMPIKKHIQMVLTSDPYTNIQVLNFNQHC